MMKNQKKSKGLNIFIVLHIIVLSICFAAMGCMGPMIDEVDPTEELVLSANESLQEGDVENALEDYGEAIENDAHNSTARFGRALTRLMLIIEQDQVTDVLAGFGQEPWMASSVFGEEGYLYTDDTSGLPFSRIGDCTSIIRREVKMQSIKRCVMGQVVDGYNLSTMTDSIYELSLYIESIIIDISVAIEDEEASYVIPRELYNGSDDIHINHADMVQTLAGMYFLQASVLMVNAWELDIELSGLFDEDGNFIGSEQEVVDSLNDSFTLRDVNGLEFALDSLVDAFFYSSEAMAEVLEGSSGGILDLTEENVEIYQELSDITSAASESLDVGEAVIPHVIPELTSDLDNFFTDPFDAAEIEHDPFVLEDGSIKAVEAFWKDVAKRAGNYDSGSGASLKIFSDVVRSLPNPWHQIFGDLLGRRYGSHTLGRQI